MHKLKENEKKKKEKTDKIIINMKIKRKNT